MFVSLILQQKKKMRRRGGGWVWELKIDPKRLEEKKNSHFEEVSKRRNEKKRQI